MATTTMPHVDDVDEKAVVCLRAGSSIVQAKPIFSHDSKCLLCGCGHNVKVYSTESGECIHEMKAHTDEVTGLALNPANKLQLLSCSLDKQIMFWDYTDGVMLKSVQFPQRLCGLSHVEVKAGQFHFTVLIPGHSHAPTNKITSAVLMRYTVAKDSHVSKSLNIFETCYPETKTTAVGLSGNKEYYYAAALPNQKELLIYHNEKRLRYKTLGNKITCMAAHPTEPTLATGMQDGKIYYWYCLTNEKQMVKTIYHWHALPVISLTFSVAGSYLLSGGHECTLVKWQYETHYKDFLPRLGSPITHISTSQDNLLYALAHTDNGIHLVQNTLNISQIYQGLTKAGECYGMPVGLHHDPRSAALVTNGRPGHLQFYSLHTDKQLYNLDIVQQNYVSSDKLGKPLTVTQITHAALDERGDWLVTYQLWDDGVMSPEMQLKFWQYDAEKQSYIMNTVVDRPHEKRLTSLKLRPYSLATTPPLAVTGGRDCRFKLWTLVDDTDIYRVNNKWTCDSVGFYRDMETGQTAFAEDGSLLAVVFQAAITLWDPETNVLRTTLCNSFKQSNVKHVEFGRDSCCHLLVSTTAEELCVWNLLTCTVEWRVRLTATSLVVDPLTKYMAVFTDNRDLHVFEPSNPKPVFSKTEISKTAVTRAVFLPHKEESSSSQGRLVWQRQSQLYFMTSDQVLLTVQYQTEESTTDGNSKKTAIKQSVPQSALSLIISKQGKQTAGKSPRTEHLDMSEGSKEKQFIKQMLNGTFAAQPPISSICLTFLETRMSKKTVPGHEASRTDMADDDDLDKIDEGIQLNIQVDSDSDMEVDDNQRSRSSVTKIDADSKLVLLETESDLKKLHAALNKDYSWFKQISKYDGI